MNKFAVVLPAAGKSTRFGDPFRKKVYATIGGKPLWMFAAEAFAKRDDVAQILLIIGPDDKELFNEKYAGNAAMLGVRPVLGGQERADSVLNGLKEIDSGVDFVAVHDAARPCVSERDIDAVFAVAARTNAAILATRCSSTVKRVNEHQEIVETVPREGLWLAQTPQVFRLQLLRDAYSNSKNPKLATDEASLVQELGATVSIVEGSSTNIKVTTKEDLKLAELALKISPKKNPFPF